MDECLSSGMLTLGRYGREFEQRFATRVGTAYAVAVNSGTSSLEIPLRIFGVTGKVVLVPTNTFFATAAAVVHAGGTPRFVDADPDTFSVDVAGLKKSLTPDTAGVIVVHIGGIVTPHMPEIQAFCREHGLFLLEDAAHAHGCSSGGQNAGTFGDAASFSFYPTKVMTSGEGGMIVTNDKDVYEEALVYRDQGKAGFNANFHTRLGYNWRMSEVHAIIGLAQLARLEEFSVSRRKIAAIYDSALAGIPGLVAVPLPARCESSYYKYLAMLDSGIDRGALKKTLRDCYEVALSGEVYDTPCHQQPVFHEYADGALPAAEDICSRHICLPVFANMSEDQARHVVSSLAAVLRGS